MNHRGPLIMAIFTLLLTLTPGVTRHCLAADIPTATSRQPASQTADHTSRLSSPDPSHLLFTETFDDLDAWEELTFPKISRHSTYTTVPDKGDPGAVDGKVLKTQSNSSASGILWKGEFNVYEYPGLSWRWRISNIYENGNASLRDGDDYPARLYVMFKYVPSDPAVKKSLKYTVAKIFYGQVPPYRSLNYIWANREHSEPFLPNSYTDKAMMFILRAGDDMAGDWVLEKVNIVDDYRRAFGTDPPAIASLAIMNDSDNTGESSVSWFDDVKIYSIKDNGK